MRGDEWWEWWVDGTDGGSATHSVMGLDESELQWLVRGWRRESGNWFQRPWGRKKEPVFFYVRF